MKRTNRIRISGLKPIITRDDAAEAVASIAGLSLERNAAQLLLDDEIKAAHDSFDEKISTLNKLIELKSERIQEWAEANPDEFPKGRKSIEFPQGTIGYRTGTPKLKTTGRGVTWAKALEAIKRLGLLDWIRTEESVNKERIIADARGASDSEVPREFVLGKMREVGVEVAQTESFFIEPKIEELTNRVAEAV